MKSIPAARIRQGAALPAAALLAILCAFTAGPAEAALNAYMTLTANGVEIEGESTLFTIGGVDVSEMIECYAAEQEIFTAAGSDPRTGSRAQFSAFKILKRLDKATPLLYKALDRNEEIDATIRYFDNDPDSGETRHRFTIQLSGARITGVRHRKSNSIDPASAALPDLEEISLIFHTMTVRDVVNSIEYTLTRTTSV